MKIKICVTALVQDIWKGKGSPTFVFPPVFQKKGYALYGVGVVRVDINV